MSLLKDGSVNPEADNRLDRLKYKFLETTNHLYNNKCGNTMSIQDFESNFLLSHKFECEISNTGWIGINLKLSETKETEPLCLVCWFITENKLTVDKFHSVEKIN